MRADVKYLIQPIYNNFNYNINFRLFIKRYQHQVELALTQIWWTVLESFSQYNKSNKSEKGAFVMKLGLWSSPEDAFLEFVYANESVSHRKILLLNCTLMESSNIEKIITKKNKLFKRTMHFDSLFFHVSFYSIIVPTAYTHRLSAWLRSCRCPSVSLPILRIPRRRRSHS